MPTKNEHLTKADKNRSFGEAMNPLNQTVAEWTLTVFFYSALHYVEAFNGKFNKHCRNHAEVGDSILRNAQLDAIYEDYKDLLNFSWNARYRTTVYGPSEVEQARRSLTLIRDRTLAIL